ALDAVAVLPLPAGTPAARPREAASRLSPLPQPTPTPAPDKVTPRPSLTHVDDIENLPTRVMPPRGARTPTPVPPLPGTPPPLPRGTPTPFPSSSTGPSSSLPEAAWLAFLLFPLRFALFPLRIFRRLRRGSAYAATTVIQPPHRMLPWWLMGRWWFWVGIGIVASVFSHSAREERRRQRETEARSAAEAPAAVNPSAHPNPDPHPAPASDEDLQEKVEEALKSSKLTRDEEIQVEADEGSVTLSGEVKSPLVSQVAQALAETVAGSDKVKNQIKVPRGHPERPTVWPDLSQIPFFGTRPLDPGSPEGKALAELLQRGKQALADGNPEEALGLFGAALSLDPRNKIAHDGLQEAGKRMGKRRPDLPPPPAEAPTPPPPRSGPAASAAARLSR